MLARAVYALLGAIPASALARSRTSAAAARPLERAFAAVTSPLRGRTLAVRTGAAAGLLLRADRRSIVWLTGRVEPEVQQAVDRLLSPGATFVDVGASVGFFSLLAARRVGPGGRVVAFEPAPDQAAAARANAELNGFEQVAVVACAVSSTEGSAFLGDSGTATASLAPDASPGALEVRTTSLDAFLAARPGLAPDVVKVDVEGHEADVVRGMRRTLAQHEPQLVVELHGDPTVLDALEASGYRWTELGAPASAVTARGWGHVLASPNRAA